MGNATALLPATLQLLKDAGDDCAHLLRWLALGLGFFME